MVSGLFANYGSGASGTISMKCSKYPEYFFNNQENIVLLVKKIIVKFWNASHNERIVK